MEGSEERQESWEIICEFGVVRARKWLQNESQITATRRVKQRKYDTMLPDCVKG